MLKKRRFYSFLRFIIFFVVYFAIFATSKLIIHGELTSYSKSGLELFMITSISHSIAYIAREKIFPEIEESNIEEEM